MQPVGDRPREVCSVCGEIFYQNPLPAAAALVLDGDRRVLLVRRKFPPNQGMWCLPTGFAEMGETIAEAALRELREETGLTGRVARLIDADSWKSSFYGDVLVVTFEVDKLSGTETAGDDADDAGLLRHRQPAASGLPLQREGHQALRRPPPRRLGHPRLLPRV